MSSKDSSLKSTIAVSLTNYLDAGAIVAGASGLTLWQQYLGLTEIHLGWLNFISANCLGAAIGSIIGGFLADKYGRKQTLIGMSILSWFVTVIYMLVAMNQYITLALGFFVGLSAIGMFAALGPFLADLFPTHIRTTGMGFSYNVGKSVGALSIVGVGMLAELLGLPTSIGLFCLGAYALATVSIILVKVPKEALVLTNHHYQNKKVSI